MRKNILITVLALLGLALPVLAATTDFVADGNITVSDVTFEATTADMLIMNGSQAESWSYDGGTFTITNPDATAPFKVGTGASESSVSSIKIKNSSASYVACAVNSTPGTSYVSLPSTAGTYTVEPSDDTNSATADCCATVSNAATYNAFPTCGAATCASGYGVIGSGASATCEESIGGSTSAGGGGGGGGIATATPTPTPASYSNGSLLRASGVEKVYLIDNGKKHWIPTGEIFTANGYSWSSVKVVSSSVLAQYAEGSNVQKTTSSAVPATSADTSFIPEGGLIRAKGDIDVYIVKYIGAKKFKRLILSPSVFNSYGHLKWSDIKDIDQSTVDAFTVSDLVRTVGDPRVYRLYPSGDTGQKRWVKTAEGFARMGFDWDAIYEINQVDRNSYVTGETIE